MLVGRGTCSGGFLDSRNVQHILGVLLARYPKSCPLVRRTDSALIISCDNKLGLALLQGMVLPGLKPIRR